MEGLFNLATMLLQLLLLAVSAQSYRSKESDTGTLNQILGKADRDLDELTYRLSLLSEKIDDVLRDREDAELVSKRLSNKLGESQGLSSEKAVQPFSALSWTSSSYREGKSGTGYRSEEAVQSFPTLPIDKPRFEDFDEPVDRPGTWQVAGTCNNSAIPRQIQPCHVTFMRTFMVGGCEAVPHSWPWMVSIRYRGVHVCGGSLLNDQWVITADHCWRKLYLDDVLVGSHYWKGNDDPYEDEVEIAEVFPYGNYKHDDITLVKLARPVNMSDGVSPVCLPEKSNDYDTDDVEGKQRMAMVMGWGYTEPTDEDPKGDLAEVLMEVYMPLISRKECSRYHGLIRDNMLCAGDGGRDACQSDSGGPLVVWDPNDERWELLGIVSRGDGCGYKPGIYTYVPKYLDWINETIDNNS